jgi:polar amino acid transport system substrate-binding protein
MTRPFQRVAICALLVTAVGACQGAAAPTTAPATAGASSQAPAPASSAAAQTLHSGVLTIVFPDFPYPGYIEGNDPTAPTGGYFVAMSNEVAKRLGVTPKYDKVDFTAMIGGQFKDYDISVDSFSITPERQAKFNQTVPVVSYYEGIMTKKGTKVATADDVRNLVLGACGTCNLFKYITDVIKPVKEPRAFDQDLQKYDALVNGQIDGALGDIPVILRKTTEPKFKDTQAACKFKKAVDQAWILPKDSKIIDQVNKIISDLKADGTLAKWEAQYITPLSGGVDPSTVPDCPDFGA